LVLLKQVSYLLIISWVFVAGGCASDADPDADVGTVPINDSTSTETCFDVTIASSGSSSTKSLCVTDENNRFNGLGVYRFVRFNVDSRKSMTFTATRTSGLDPADPDIYIYKNGQTDLSNISESIVANVESFTKTLDAGDYVLQIFEHKYTLDNSKTSLPSLKQTLSKMIDQETISNALTGTMCVSSAAVTNVSLSGVVTYDRVSHNLNNGLDYGNIIEEPVKNAVVELMCGTSNVLLTTNTDENGNYSFSVPFDLTGATIRVKAQMQKTGAPSYNFSVVDNTQSQSLYAMDSEAFNVQGVDILDKDLHAQSGWSIQSSAYTSTRVAGPFAILDSVFVAMSKVLEVNSVTVFPELKINWSINNTSASGNTSLGQITSSHYNGTEIFILGAEDNDTDEYDGHVIIHEWGHYFEDKFSRSDSIGGEHSFRDRLDIRVAFGEGFGNAYSAIASGDVTYRDTSGSSQASGFNFNLENNNCTNPGWYSECSVQSILYDLFDSSDDGNDSLSMGFAPIYNVLVDEQKNTVALTSIFSFIKVLKDENTSISNGIDTLVGGQNIDAITDIYGDSEISNNPGTTDQLPVFTQM
jgi:hypothetical protein